MGEITGVTGGTGDLVKSEDLLSSQSFDTLALPTSPKEKVKKKKKNLKQMKGGQIKKHG